MSATKSHKPRAPRQARAAETREAFLEAARRVLVKVGYDGASVEEIARVAGASVGSLYRYFPSRDAMVAEVIEEQTSAIVSTLMTHAASYMQLPPKQGVPSMVRAYIEAHRIEPALYAALWDGANKIGRSRLVHERLMLFAEGLMPYFRAHRDALAPKDIDIAVFVNMCNLQSAVHFALLERPEWMLSEAFCAELVHATVSYLLV